MSTYIDFLIENKWESVDVKFHELDDGFCLIDDPTNDENSDKKENSD